MLVSAPVSDAAYVWWLVEGVWVGVSSLGELSGEGWLAEHPALWPSQADRVACSDARSPQFESSQPIRCGVWSFRHMFSVTQAVMKS